MRISVLALEGLWDTELTVTLDAFGLANKFSALQMAGTPHFDVSVVGCAKEGSQPLGNQNRNVLGAEVNNLYRRRPRPEPNGPILLQRLRVGLIYRRLGIEQRD